jgi:hypothetical protein
VDLEARRSRWAGELAGDARTALNRGLQEARTQLGQEIAQIAGTGSGLFARREVAVEDRSQVRARVAERAWLEYREVSALVTGAAARIDGELIEVIEQTAATIGPPESRTLRRRLEGALSETEALRRDARERLATTPRAIVEALTRELGDRVMELVAQARTESERDAALQRLVAPVGGETIDTVTKWAEEYLAVAAGLCERAERDLDILALDIEHRIIRPFSAVLDAIRSDATDAATQALEQ